jgi:hypothetical protein
MKFIQEITKFFCYIDKIFLSEYVTVPDTGQPSDINSFSAGTLIFITVITNSRRYWTEISVALVVWSVVFHTVKHCSWIM